MTQKLVRAALTPQGKEMFSNLNKAYKEMAETVKKILDNNPCQYFKDINNEYELRARESRKRSGLDW